MTSEQHSVFVEAVNKLRVAHRLSGDYWYKNGDIVNNILNSAFDDITSIVYKIPEIVDHTEDLGKFLVWRKVILESTYTTTIRKSMILIIIDSMNGCIVKTRPDVPIDFRATEEELQLYKDKIDAFLKSLDGTFDRADKLHDIANNIYNFVIGEVDNDILREMLQSLFGMDEINSLCQGLHIVNDSIDIKEVIVKTLKIKLSSVSNELYSAIYNIR